MTVFSVSRKGWDDQCDGEGGKRKKITPMPHRIMQWIGVGEEEQRACDFLRHEKHVLPNKETPFLEKPSSSTIVGGEKESKQG